MQHYLESLVKEETHVWVKLKDGKIFDGEVNSFDDIGIALYDYDRSKIILIPYTSISHIE